MFKPGTIPRNIEHAILRVGVSSTVAAEQVGDERRHERNKFKKRWGRSRFSRHNISSLR
jgi:hypothetical protein